MLQNSVTDLPKVGIKSLNLPGWLFLFNKTSNVSTESMDCLLEPLTSSGIQSGSTKLYMLFVIVAEVINAMAMQQNVLSTFSAVFDLLPVCVIKYSCAVLVKHNFEFSIHKY